LETVIFLATVQSRITKSLIDNRNEIEQLLRRSADAGATIVHFPEGALSGQAKSEITSWNNYNWNRLNTQLKDIGQLCSELNIWAVIGSAHFESDGEHPFNSLYVFNSSGELTTRYDKRYCSHTEITDWYRAGKSAVTIDVDGIKFGLALCIEIQFPELFQEYERLDVDCVLLSAYSDRPMFGIQSQGHAACNNYWVSLSVPSHCSHRQTSCLIGPDGNIIDACENNISDIIVNEIDPQSPEWEIPCQKARPWRRIARTGKIYNA